MSLYRDQGVVLRTYRLREADRIVVLLTRGHGKVRAVAKGVRRTTSRFGSRLEPTSHVSLQLYEGRELDTITQAETIDHFPSVRADLDRLGQAASILEAVDHVAQEREVDVRLYQMVVGALRSLDARSTALVVPAFFLKLLAHDGVGLEVITCVACGDDDDLVAIDATLGGGTCRACRHGLAVSPEALALLRLILGGQLGTALNESLSPATREVEAVATNALELHLERRLRAATLLS